MVGQQVEAVVVEFAVVESVVVAVVAVVYLAELQLLAVLRYPADFLYPAGQ